MNGGHYIKSKDGFALVAEMMNALLFEQFLAEESYVVLENLIEEIQNDFIGVQDDLDYENYNDFKTSWEQCKNSQKDLVNAFMKWKENSGDENVQYWTYFVDEIYPIQRDMTYAIRVGNWQLFVSTVHRALDLFFACGKTNYSREAPLFYEDCKDLERKFPQVYRAFEQRAFVMYHSDRLGSAVGFDMALEKVYNKPAKIKGGIIGLTRRKEAVALWNLLKHEKDIIVADLAERCRLSEQEDELNFHHDFTPTTSEKGYERRVILTNYILSIGNPLTRSNKLINVVSAAEIPQDTVINALNTLEFGKNCYNDYKQKRLTDKQLSIHETITANRNYFKITPTSTANNKPASKCLGNNTVSDVVRYIDYAQLRGYNTEKLLKYELTYTAFYLEKKDEKLGTKLKKSAKSLLLNELVKELPIVQRNIK